MMVKGSHMHRFLCVLIATIAYGTTAAHCQTPHARTTAITFQSTTFSDLGQLLARKAATGTVTVAADLSFPEEAKDRYPVIVIVHTIGGYRVAKATPL